MKTITKILSAVVVLALLVSCFTLCVSARESATLHFSKNSIQEGEDITVSVNINPEKEMSNIAFFLNYDPEVLSYVDGDGTKDSDGIISVDKPVSNEKSTTLSFTFTGEKEGKSSITVSDCIYITKKDEKDVQKKFVGASAVVRVKKAKLANEALLKSLSVEDYKLSPEFSSKKTAYTAKIPNDVESIEIIATPSNKNAKVNITGNDNLKVGNNKVKITVEAKNGKKNTYTIVVTRAEADNKEDNETDSEQTVAGTGLETNIDGNPYTIITKIPESALFKGFKVEETEVNGYTIETAIDVDANYRVFYLKNDKSDDLIPYLYDVTTDEFKLLKHITIGENTYIIEDLPDDISYPDNIYPSNLDFGDFSVECLADANSEMNTFKYIYCLFNGQRGIYRYDTQENTLQRYPDLELGTTANANTGDSVVDRFGTLSTNGKVIVIALIIVILGVLALLLLLVVYLIRRSVNRNEDILLYSDDDFDEIDITNEGNNNQ